MAVSSHHLRGSPAWPIRPLAALMLLILASLACAPDRENESVIDQMVDDGATLQARETLDARVSGPTKEPAGASQGEGVPDLDPAVGPTDDPGDEPEEVEMESMDPLEALGADEVPSTEEDSAEPPSITDFSGYWHSAAACDEQDAPYRWEVELRQDASGNVAGTIKFHLCPGGGRAAYNVHGRATSEDTISLQGTKDSGESRGDLGDITPASQTFQLMPGGPPDPNYVGQ